MSFAKVYSAQTSLLEAHIIDVEVDLSNGLHAFSIVGLPGKAVEESRDRVSAAIKNSGFTSPKNKNQKVIISLAPADLKKEGPAFDLGIALAYLLANEDISFDPTGKLFLGELSLDGELREINGTLPLVRKARQMGFKEVFLPAGNAEEAALIEGIAVFGARTLSEIINHLIAEAEEEASELPRLKKQPETKIPESSHEGVIDFGDIRGQESAKRGLLIAAAGRHNIVLYGPPGTGKTMLARAFADILPRLSFDEILEVTSIHSIAGTLDETLLTTPPFRSPHHTASYVSLVGGGTTPKPGEITLAHRGVLFLDEFPEFERRTIDALRQPLEERTITVTRAKGSARFPANFILVAAMNPPERDGIEQARFEKKISGPIVDRVDMWIEVGHIDHKMLGDNEERARESGTLREKVACARSIQRERFLGEEKTNNEMTVRDLGTHVPLEENVRNLLNTAAGKLDLSPRAYHRVVKLARTIADIDESEDVKDTHILEALQYRPRSFR
ncbi:MAG: YifB family Mg chelatase-like AAA ATPase [Candidatus Pacebacteria bacterium]|nr:YifB family Mg chelatase-like AAA ATPase [Candidatus Paceibacterota bacterium]